VLTVVKVGGGLARAAGDEALRALCEHVAAAGARHRLLVVAGGGALADAVRDHDRRFGLRPATAHWMAVLAMDQQGLLLADLIAGAATCSDLGGIAPAGVSVLLPYAALRARDPLPASWAVTSDSIAAWVAGAARADRLVLVKPVAGLHPTWPDDGDPMAELSVDELGRLRPGGVDAHLPVALREACVETWVIDGRDPALLAQLLATGSTRGTRIAAAERP
jgi:5-(aminomethyl)-3-furanmethanol phosphate kinase